jgi:hypothetical protein
LSSLNGALAALGWAQSSGQMGSGRRLGWVFGASIRRGGNRRLRADEVAPVADRSHLVRRLKTQAEGRPGFTLTLVTTGNGGRNTTTAEGNGAGWRAPSNFNRPRNHRFRSG